MHLENPPKSKPHVAQLVAAGDKAAAHSTHDPLIVKCPLQQAGEGPQRVAIEPFRILMWNIKELGGGFFMPERRPDHCIDAYATIIHKLDVDVCVVMGIRK